MTAQLKSSFHISLEKVPRISSIAVFVVGCIVLVGWQFDLPALTSMLPGLASMKANSAMGGKCLLDNTSALSNAELVMNNYPRSTLTLPDA